MASNLSARAPVALRHALGDLNDGNIAYNLLKNLAVDSTGMDFTADATGNAVDVTAAALTTGKVLDASDLDAITTGTGIHLDATGITQTSGKLIHVDSASTALTSAGRLILSDHTGASSVSGVLNEFLSAATDETVIAQVKASGALALGVALNLSVASVTTGKGLQCTDNTALTTGILAHLATSATAIATTGRLLYSNHTGATSTSGILNEFASAANDETVIVKVTASDALAAGVALQVSGASVTTGTAVGATDLNALTTGKGLHLASSATAITTTGRMLYVNHTGATGTTAILSEFASAANDETVIVKVTASAALALGAALQVSGAAITTGNAVKITDLDALTTGNGVDIRSNSADTGTRALLNIVNDNTAATGTSGLAIQNDATAGAHIKLTGTGILGIDFTALGATDFLFDCTASDVGAAAPQTNAPVGFIRCKVAGTAQYIPYYNAT